MKRRSWALVLALLVGCNPVGRSAEELRATPYGQMATPSGSALWREYYKGPEGGIDGVSCPSLRRTYASNDIVAFHREFQRVGEASGAEWIGTKHRSPHVRDDQKPGRGEWVAVAGTGVTVNIIDLDRPDEIIPEWIDADVWRYVVEVWMTDSQVTMGGTCDQ